MRKLLLAALLLYAFAAPAAASAAGPIPGTWGGTISNYKGESVTVDVSIAYPQDPAVQQRWADFLGTLIHGPEVTGVTLVIAPLAQVQRICGRSALACYMPQTQLIYAPGDDLADGPTAQSIVAHEYGHHVAQNQDNDPWVAEDWGTKRWATAMGICARVKVGQLAPGSEGSNYEVNPGEAFAESYRLLNEQSLGLPISPWDVVDDSLQPGVQALDALRLDLAAPWTGPTTKSYSGSFSKSARTAARTFTVATPLDGSLAVKVTSPKGTLFRATPAATTVCGARTTTVKVTRVKGYGAFRLSVTLP